MAAVANLRIDQGASFSSDVTVTNSDGAAVNLAGYTTYAKMATSYGATSTITISTTTTNSYILITFFDLDWLIRSLLPSSLVILSYT